MVLRGARGPRNYPPNVKKAVKFVPLWAVGDGAPIRQVGNYQSGGGGGQSGGGEAKTRQPLETLGSPHPHRGPHTPQGGDEKAPDDEETPVGQEKRQPFWWPF